MSAPNEVMLAASDPEVPIVTAEIADPLGHSTELGLTPRDALNVQAAIVGAEDELGKEFSPLAVQAAEADAYQLVRRAVAASFRGEEAKRVDPIQITRETLVATSRPESMRLHLVPEVPDEKELAARAGAQEELEDDAVPYNPFADDDEDLPEFNIASARDFVEDIRVIARTSIKAQESLLAQDTNPEIPRLSVVTAEIGEVALAKQIAETDNPALRDELTEVLTKLRAGLAEIVEEVPVVLPENAPTHLSRSRAPRIRQLIGASAMTASLLLSRMRSR